MTFIVSFLPGALDDIRRQSAWYEDKKTGLAARFERAVKEKTKLLESTPHTYKEVHGVRQDPQALKSILEKRT